MSNGIDLSEKLSAFSEHWSPRTVTQFNNCDVMVVKVEGEFVWHKHDDTDDFFLVLKGVLDLQLGVESTTEIEDADNEHHQQRQRNGKFKQCRAVLLFQ